MARSVRPDQERLGQPLQNDVVWNLCEVGRLEGNDAGAMTGHADLGVFLQYEHLEPGLGTARGRQQPRRASADDRDVEHPVSINRM